MVRVADILAGNEGTYRDFHTHRAFSPQKWIGTLRNAHRVTRPLSAISGVDSKHLPAGLCVVAAAAATLVVWCTAVSVARHGELFLVLERRK